jgi:hypothetical protein
MGIAEELAEAQAEIVGNVHGQPISRKAMQAAFELVQNRENWKLPIDAVVAIESDFERELIYHAVMFYTGSIAQFYRQGPVQYRVRAMGYYAAVGA